MKAFAVLASAAVASAAPEAQTYLTTSPLVSAIQPAVQHTVAAVPTAVQYAQPIASTQYVAQPQVQFVAQPHAVQYVAPQPIQYKPVEYKSVEIEAPKPMEKKVEQQQIVSAYTIPQAQAAFIPQVSPYVYAPQAYANIPFGAPVEQKRLYHAKNGQVEHKAIYKREAEAEPQYFYNGAVAAPAIYPQAQLEADYVTYQTGPTSFKKVPTAAKVLSAYGKAPGYPATYSYPTATYAGVPTQYVAPTQYVF